MSEKVDVKIEFGGRYIGQSDEVNAINRIISVSITRDKRKEYDTCRVVLDNKNLFYNNAFKEYYEDYLNGTNRYNKTLELRVYASVYKSRMERIFNGIVIRTRMSYSKTSGFLYVIDAVSYEWILSKSKLEKPLEFENEDPMNKIKELLVSHEIHVDDSFLEKFNPTLWRGVGFRFPAGMPTLQVIKKLCLFMKSIFWIDDYRFAHIARRDKWFNKPSRHAKIGKNNILRYGDNIISAEFEERNLDKIFDEVYVYASAPQNTYDSHLRLRERNGHSGRRRRGNRILNLFLGYVNILDTTNFLDELAKEIRERLSDTPLIARVTITGNPYIKTKTTRLMRADSYREDIVKIETTHPLDFYSMLETETISVDGRFRRRKDYTVGYFFVESITHDITKRGFTTTLEISQKYYESREGLLQSLEEEIRQFERRVFLTGYVKNTTVAPPMIEVELQEGTVFNKWVIKAKYLMWNTSINKGVYALPEIGSKVLVVRVAMNEYYVIGNIYDEQFKPGNNERVKEIRIGEYAIQIDDKGNLKFGSTATGIFKRIALEDHTHNLTSSHTHNVTALGAPTGPPINQDSAQQPTTGLSSQKILCEKG